MPALGRAGDPPAAAPPGFLGLQKEQDCDSQDDLLPPRLPGNSPKIPLPSAQETFGIPFDYGFMFCF